MSIARFNRATRELLGLPAAAGLTVNEPSNPRALARDADGHRRAARAAKFSSDQPATRSGAGTYGKENGPGTPTTTQPNKETALMADNPNDDGNADLAARVSRLETRVSTLEDRVATLETAATAEPAQTPEPTDQQARSGPRRLATFATAKAASDFAVAAAAKARGARR